MLIKKEKDKCNTVTERFMISYGMYIMRITNKCNAAIIIILQCSSSIIYDFAQMIDIPPTWS